MIWKTLFLQGVKMLDNYTCATPAQYQQDAEYACCNCLEPVDSEGERCPICVGLVSEALMAAVMQADGSGWRMGGGMAW